jgi:Flp pilus assembly protein TadD
MAKPPALVTLPCALLLLDFWPLARLRLFKGQPHGQTGGAPISHQPASLPGCSIGWLLLEKLPLFLLAAGAAAVTVFAHRGLGMGSYAVHRLPFLLRVENAFVSYARYLGKAVWPAKLCVLYPHPGVWPAWQVAASVALFAAVTGGVIRAARGQPWLFVGWFWFVGTLVPVIGLIQVGVQAMADRFAYVSLIGLFVLVVWGAADLAQRWRIGNGIRGAAAGVALVSCIVTTSLQLRHWENSITLFEHATRVTTNSFVAHNNLSMALLRANRPDEAEVHIREALRILPKAAEARFQLGVVSDIKGRSEQAVENYREAARLKPDWPAPKALLGTALYRQGLTNEAIVQFSAVLKLIPDDAETHSYLGLLLSGQGRVAEAIDHYRAALQTRPDWPEALNNLAWIFATNPKSEVRNGPDAVRLAGRACELAGRREAVFLGTLAAAYAEAGRFEDAARTAREAIDLASSRGQKDLAATNARLLELYRAGKPFREEGP